MTGRRERGEDLPAGRDSEQAGIWTGGRRRQREGWDQGGRDLSSSATKGLVMMLRF